MYSLSTYILHVTRFNYFRFATAYFEFYWKIIMYYPLLRLLEFVLELYHLHYTYYAREQKEKVIIFFFNFSS